MKEYAYYSEYTDEIIIYSTKFDTMFIILQSGNENYVINANLIYLGEL
jgi:hypothetical protein